MHFLVPENTAAKKIYLRNAVMVVIIRGMRGPKKGGVGEGGGGREGFTFLHLSQDHSKFFNSHSKITEYPSDPPPPGKRDYGLAHGGMGAKL